MGCGEGADMIRDGLRERVKRRETIREKEKMAMGLGWAVESYLGFKLHRRRSPPHCNPLL